MPERLTMEQPVNQERKETQGVVPHSIHIDGYYRGFHVEVIQTDPNAMEQTYQLIRNAKTIIDAMEKDGWLPSWNMETVKNLKGEKREVETPKEELPMCPIHNKPMKKRTAPDGSEFYSHGFKTKEGGWLWCSGQGFTKAK